MKIVVRKILILCVIGGFAPALLAQTTCFERTMRSFEQRRWAEAAADFSECEKIEPGKTDALLYRGKALVNLGQYQEASASLESYRLAHPQSEDAAYLLAYILFRQNKPANSLRLFTEAGKLKNPTADDLKIVALDYVLLNDYDDAARYLEKSLAIDPTNTEVRYHLGRVLYQQNRFDLAIIAFQKVLQRDPTNVKAQDNLGLSLEAKNEIEPAIAAYRKAIAFDEPQAAHNEQPYLNLGTLLEKSDRLEEAIPWLVRATTIAPSFGKAHYQLAKVYFEMNRFENARQEAERSVSLDSGDSTDHYLLGRIYQRTGKTELAKEQFRITEELMKQKPSTSNGMASEMGQR